MLSADDQKENTLTFLVIMTTSVEITVFWDAVSQKLTSSGQEAPLKRRSVSARLYGATSEKIVV
jgi:hypothetical protein